MIAVTPNIDALEPLEGPTRPAAMDESLKGRFARGEAGAFEELIALHRPRVTQLAYRLLGWRGEVEDVVQEVFLAAFKNLGRFRGQASLGTWLTTITINVCRSHRRRQLVRWRFFRRASVESEIAEAADQRPIDAETNAAVRRVVQELPAGDREVIVLHYLEHLSADEIAESLNIRRNAVDVRLHRARQKLKVKLSGLVEP